MSTTDRHIRRRLEGAYRSRSTGKTIVRLTVVGLSLALFGWGSFGRSDRLEANGNMSSNGGGGGGGLLGDILKGVGQIVDVATDNWGGDPSVDRDPPSTVPPDWYQPRVYQPPGPTYYPPPVLPPNPLPQIPFVSPPIPNPNIYPFPASPPGTSHSGLNGTPPRRLPPKHTCQPGTSHSAWPPHGKPPKPVVKDSPHDPTNRKNIKRTFTCSLPYKPHDPTDPKNKKKRVVTCCPPYKPHDPTNPKNIKVIVTRCPPHKLHDPTNPKNLTRIITCCPSHDPSNPANLRVLRDQSPGDEGITAIPGADDQTLEQAIAVVASIKDPDPLKQDRLRAKKAVELVTARVKVVNDFWGTVFQTLPIDVWNKFSGGSIKTRAQVLDYFRGQPGDLAKVAWILKAGQCDEHASLMQEILRGAGVRNVINLRSDSPHVFPVVDLAPGYDADIPWTWGKDAFVPDSWTGEIVDGSKVWDGSHYFNGGKCHVDSGLKPGNTTREKLALMIARGPAFLNAHRDTYDSLVRQYMTIPKEIRDTLPLKLPTDAELGAARESR